MLAAKSQTSLDFARLHVTFRPWRGITFCNELARRIVILNTAPLDFAGEPKCVTAKIINQRAFVKQTQTKKPLSITERLLAVRTGLEPVTPCVTGMYSNQLN